MLCGRHRVHQRRPKDEAGEEGDGAEAPVAVGAVNHTQHQQRRAEHRGEQFVVFWRTVAEGRRAGRRSCGIQHVHKVLLGEDGWSAAAAHCWSVDAEEGGAHIGGNVAEVVEVVAATDIISTTLR